MTDLELYLYPIIGYVVVYAVAYFGPFLWSVLTSTLGSDVETLSRRIDVEVQKERERHTRDAHGRSVSDSSEAESAEGGAPDDGEEKNQQARVESWIEEEQGNEAEEGEHAEAEGPESDNEDEKSESDGATEDSFLSRTLESSFSSTLVQQAVEQLRTKYPHGDFRRFEIERLPAYATYDERLTAARNMAGLFVLFGLLGTMYKLNQIVQKIGDAAGQGREGQVQAEQFLNNMGEIMADIGGAFDSSIWGLALMVLFLVVIGLVDRYMQYQLNKLDHTVQNTVIPGLSELQLMQAPNLSIGDLIDETSTLLTDLNHSVQGMTEGMNDALGELSGEIHKMMEDFGSFQNQYAQLNDLINNLKDYTENVEDVTAAIEGAGHTLANPISQMNRDLNDTIREHMGVVGDAIEASEANRDALTSSFQEMEQDLQRLTRQLRDIARDSLEQIENHQQNLEDTLEKQQEVNAAAVEKEIERLEAQSEAIQEELQATAEALESANSQELARVLDALQKRLDDSASSLSSSAGQLTSSAQEISESADRLERATKGMEIKQKGPVTLFDWVRRSVEEARDGR